jgi:raffinose/stachyose/melibiose transport system substrate-binding protein
MKKRIVCSMVLTMALVFGTSCSSKEAEDVQETGAASTAESITILNIKGEVAPQMQVLADE